MKSITTYINEKMTYTKATAPKSKSEYKYSPKTKEELAHIIEKLVDEQSMEDVINLNDIDTSKITDMSKLFASMEGLLKIDISNWDASNVETMENMFRGCVNLEQIIGIENLDVSNVTNMRQMFRNCNEFNQPLNNWNVSNVTDMMEMFMYCESFNQPLDKWDVSSVKNMESMFQNCKSFNQDLSKWDVSNVTNNPAMFLYCKIKGKYIPKFKI